jgi:hypothetical protein
MKAKTIRRWTLNTSLIWLFPIWGVAQVSQHNATIQEAQARISGAWRGTSECAVKDSPCHDEVNIYRFAEIPGRPGWFSGTGSKVVDGKEIPMGTLNWIYDAGAHALRSESSGATFDLIISGYKIEGRLTLSDNTVYRHIHLEKED